MSPATPDRKRRHAARSVPETAWPIDPAKPAVECEVTPNNVVTLRLPDSIPEYAITGLVPDGKGGYLTAQALWSQHVALGKDVPQQLGIPIHLNTFYRLILAGCLQASELTPRTWLLDLRSLAKHLRRTRIKGGQPSWWTRERVEAWRESKAGRGALLPSDGSQGSGED